jgi:hypothetical protein
MSQKNGVLVVLSFYYTELAEIGDIFAKGVIHSYSFLCKIKYFKNHLLPILYF